MPEGNIRIPGSFRDPSGFVYSRDGYLYRQLNRSYQREYEQLFQSKLYQELTKNKLLIPHQEVGIELAQSEDAFRIIQPEIVPFISYPYEWSFTQLKQAALLTLDIQRIALEHGMSLKDASAYNIQFIGSRPIHIDTLSFGNYQEGKPWVAYRQFCEHFLVPMSLMSHVDIRLQRLLRTYVDGIPLDLGSALLPARTKINFGLMTHIHLHAKAQKRYSAGAPANQAKKATGRIGLKGLLGILDSLKTTTRKLKWKPSGTEWADYYETAHCSLEEKSRLVSRMLDRVKPTPGMVWDLGANTGRFSRLASQLGAYTVSWDLDPAAVEKNHLECISEVEESLLPLLLDLANPSPGLGWAHEERESLLERGPTDLIMALALIHHLAISNNLPLRDIAAFFSKLTRFLIIEFVPKEDMRVQQLLASRVDIFPEYNPASFEELFSVNFDISAKERLPGTERDIYLMEARRVP